MMGNKRTWITSMSDKYKKKHKLWMCMIEDNMVEVCEDVPFTDPNYTLKDVCRVVNGTRIYCALEGNIIISIVLITEMCGVLEGKYKY